MGADVVGIVIAAGSSRRLGRPKQTLPLGDTTVLGWSLREAEASALDRVVVVLGGDAEASRTGLTPTRAEVVHNDAHDEGCASSLRAGLHAAVDAAAVVMLLGDMPGVDAAVIDAVIAQWRRRPTWGAVTAYEDRLGHPFVFSAEAFPTLQRLHGDKAVWKVVDQEPEERVARTPIARPCPADVDTWPDYAVACAELGLTPAEHAPQDPR